MEFPRMLYRSGGEWPLETGDYSLRTVADEAELDAATAEGWHLDQYAAKEAADAEAAEAAADAAPPTRAELEAKAGELGIKIDGRWSDRKLREVIDAALAG